MLSLVCHYPIDFVVKEPNSLRPEAAFEQGAVRSCAKRSIQNPRPSQSFYERWEDKILRFEQGVLPADGSRSTIDHCSSFKDQLTWIPLPSVAALVCTHLCFLPAGNACRFPPGLRPGGADRDRTGDPLLAKQVLSQLSYSPTFMERVGP